MKHRLRFSRKGFLRRIQIGQSAVAAFTEGYKDRYFYSKILEMEVGNHPNGYTLFTDREIEHPEGGKRGLIALFEEAHLTGHLDSVFLRKRTTLIFFLDKDLDEIEGKIIASPHIIYSQFYEVENYYFIHGKLAESAAALISFDPKQIEKGLGPLANWRAASARRWRIWLILCVWSKLNGYDCGCNFGVEKSQIHDPETGKTNWAHVRTYIDRMYSSRSFARGAFTKEFMGAKAVVDAALIGNRHDTIFKGKWYVPFLMEALLRITHGHQVRLNEFKHVIPGVLASTLDFEQQWSLDIRSKVRALVR